MIHQAQLTTCFIHGTSFLKVGAGADSFKKILTSKKKNTDHENSGVGGGYTYKFLSLQFHCKIPYFHFQKVAGPSPDISVLDMLQ